MNMLYKIKDKLHLTDFWYTMNTIKLMKDEEENNYRLWILYDFILRMWKRQMPGETNIERQYPKTWEALYSDLEYYSDRWSFERVYAIMLGYISLSGKYYFGKPDNA